MAEIKISLIIQRFQRAFGKIGQNGLQRSQLLGSRFKMEVALAGRNNPARSVRVPLQIFSIMTAGVSRKTLDSNAGLLTRSTQIARVLVISACPRTGSRRGLLRAAPW